VRIYQLGCYFDSKFVLIKPSKCGRFLVPFLELHWKKQLHGLSICISVEINRRLSKEEKNSEENSTTRTSDKSHHGNLNFMLSLDFLPMEDINNLVKPLDPFHHIEVSPPLSAIVPIQAQPHHYSKIAPSPPTIESQHKAIYKSTTNRPTNSSVIEKIPQPHLLQKLHLVTHGATTISNPHKTIKENRRVQIWTLGDKVVFPFFE
jgi:hypothetical protein